MKRFIHLGIVIGLEGDEGERPSDETMARAVSDLKEVLVGRVKKQDYLPLDTRIVQMEVSGIDLSLPASQAA